MNEYSSRDRLSTGIVLVVGAIAYYAVSFKAVPQPLMPVAIAQRSEIVTNSPAPVVVESELIIDEPIQVLQRNRPLRISLTVDDPSFLKVKLNDQIKQGDVITDNSTERQRMERQKKSINLQIANLKSKILVAPTSPPPTTELKNLPPANFAEEEAAINQAELKLKRARTTLATRSKFLNTDNPERRADFEKAESVLAIAQQKIQEQEQMIKAMQDMKMQPEILQHEQSKLKQIESEYDQARSGVHQAQAKLSAGAVLQAQELENLQTAVAIAESELQVSRSKLEAARNRRQIQEYQASVDANRRSQSQIQAQQDFERSRLQYEEAQRNKDYQLAQLNISLSAIEDKLSQIPIVKSPRDGYIGKITPWKGRDGKYTATITIVSNNVSLKNRSTTNPSTSID
ncbi:hypothetical protein [Nodularia sphaerocarpa]|uniref:hypothetical protein n=1 Tax=Nodularia sphaerocarpa TaxID=137816 RepID=UPI00232EB13C|nr:hypothetical protein [Nodularia sphaerocarpa]MDB9372358.1 hypothetical protein [Nodularia sphaerocarpa CS-585]MDB9377974.1 hypothetical protein [Nodularia sphaerocarpa CS-585A2]